MNIGNYARKFQTHYASQTEESTHTVTLFPDNDRTPEQKLTVTCKGKGEGRYPRLGWETLHVKIAGTGGRDVA